VYELVVSNPSKDASPLPVATYLTCDHSLCHILLAGFSNGLDEAVWEKSSQKASHDNL